MPGLRGPDLARRVIQVHPKIHVIYMSGYAEGFPEAELPANSVFLQKAFRLQRCSNSLDSSEAEVDRPQIRIIPAQIWKSGRSDSCCCPSFAT